MKRRDFLTAAVGSLVLTGVGVDVSSSSRLFAAPLVDATLPPKKPEFKDAIPQLERIRDGIPNFLAKVEAGEPIRVAYFGGSITAAPGWRVQTLAKFKELFPNSEFSEVDAAIGGTGSDLGVYRLGQDVLKHDPDLVFVEFAVNDGGTGPEHIWKQFEGIVRQIWRYNPSIDVVFVYTYRVGHENDYKSGKTPRSVSAQEQIAEFYGIPSFDFNIPVVQLAEKEQLTYQSEKPEDGKIHFSTDGVHPLDAGHQIYTEVVCDAFRKMRAQTKTTPFPAPSTRTAKLAKSFIDGNFENAKSVPIKATQLSGDWKPLPADSPLSWTKSRLGDVVFTSDAPGAKLTFRFKGSQVKIYDILGPNGGQVRVTVDGKPHNNPIPRFDSFCTYWRLATLTLADGLDPNVVHEATVEIDAEQPSRQPVAFRLADPEKELAEPKYNGRNVWFGPILVLGDVVE